MPDVRDRQTSDAHYRLLPLSYVKGDIMVPVYPGRSGKWPLKVKIKPVKWSSSGKLNPETCLWRTEQELLGVSCAFVEFCEFVETKIRT